MGVARIALSQTESRCISGYVNKTTDGFLKRMNLIVNLILKIMSVRLVIAFDKWCLIVERMFFTKGKAGDARMEMIGRVILIDAFLEKNEMVAAMCRLAGERRDGGTGPLGAAARGRSPKYGARGRGGAPSHDATQRACQLCRGALQRGRVACRASGTGAARVDRRNLADAMN
ncbi:hypothetical protein [Burkholderia pseudomallei]|uniref:hypothetical protein n=1 Tax=Burkholderia pseudomallei TaxID=28450 RepID=UPI0009B1F0E0|nr:hypothetical protein [Burkholderia pseudomallei]